MPERVQAVLRHVGFLLRLASTRAQNTFTSLLEEFNLTPDEYFVLLLLNKSEGLQYSQKQMAELLCLNVNTITRLLDQLERKKLARRLTNPQNRKENRPEITQQGVKTALVALKKVDNTRDHVYRDLTREELKELHRILLKLFNAQAPCP